jgi:hypothetical protein
MRYVILSSDDNEKYTVYKNLVDLMWRTFGWEPKWIEPFNFPGFTSATRAQVTRLYAACECKATDYLMTSDADMLPLSDYWYPAKDDKMTCWGRDLTDYHYPICYIGASAEKWVEVMKIDPFKFVPLNALQDMNDPKMRRTTPWCLDQDIVTNKILKHGIHNIISVERGIDKRTGYPVGRVDRSNWRLDHTQFIDAHLPHDITTNRKSFNNVQELYAMLKVKYKLAPKLTDLLC